jgi:hypothetical protein
LERSKRCAFTVSRKHGPDVRFIPFQGVKTGMADVEGWWRVRLATITARMYKRCIDNARCSQGRRSGWPKELALELTEVQHGAWWRLAGHKADEPLCCAPPKLNQKSQQTKLESSIVCRRGLERWHGAMVCAAPALGTG